MIRKIVGLTHNYYVNFVFQGLSVLLQVHLTIRVIPVNSNRLILLLVATNGGEFFQLAQKVEVRAEMAELT